MVKKVLLAKVKPSSFTEVSKGLIILFMVRNKHFGRNFRDADHTLSPSLWDHNKHNRVIALVNFQPRQCVLCWLLLWLRCPVTVSPPILLCQLPVLCRARGVDCVGCEPKPGWESKTHTLIHTVHLPIVCQFHNFPTSVSEADGTCVCVHPQLYITSSPFQITLKSIPESHPRSHCDWNPLPPHPPHIPHLPPQSPALVMKHGSQHVPRLSLLSLPVSLAQT